MAYTPEEKARYNAEYYERTKKLKGRSGSSSNNNSKKSQDFESASAAKAAARVKRLEGKISALNGALTEATAALSLARQKERKAKRESSDGKSTEKQKQASQEYRDKHKTELKAKAKKTSSSSGSSSSSSSKSVSDMTAEELGSRIVRIQRALKDARQQLSTAKQQLGSLAHSALASDPRVNERFAQFRSERTPST